MAFDPAMRAAWLMPVLAVLVALIVALAWVRAQPTRAPGHATSGVPAENGDGAPAGEVGPRPPLQGTRLAFEEVFQPSSGVTPDPSDVVNGLLDHVLAREQRIGFDQLSGAERTFFCCWLLDAEVNNGGFDQFLHNSSGDHAAITPAAFRSLGDEKRADMVERAIRAAFPRVQPSSDRRTRWDQTRANGEDVARALDALDEEYYAREKEDPLFRSLAAFCIAHRSEFLPADLRGR